MEEIKQRRGTVVPGVRVAAQSNTVATDHMWLVEFKLDFNEVKTLVPQFALIEFQMLIGHHVGQCWYRYIYIECVHHYGKLFQTVLLYKEQGV